VKVIREQFWNVLNLANRLEQFHQEVVAAKVMEFGWGDEAKRVKDAGRYEWVRAEHGVLVAVAPVDEAGLAGEFREHERVPSGGLHSHVISEHAYDLVARKQFMGHGIKRCNYATFAANHEDVGEPGAFLDQRGDGIAQLVGAV